MSNTLQELEEQLNKVTQDLLLANIKLAKLPTYYYEQVATTLGGYNASEDGVYQTVVLPRPLPHGVELYARVTNN